MDVNKILSQVDFELNFWHLIAVVACGLFWKMFSKHLETQETTLNDVKEILNKVVTQNEIQEVRLNNHEKRIERLESA
jgi:hypothetical protein